MSDPPGRLADSRAGRPIAGGNEGSSESARQGRGNARGSGGQEQGVNRGRDEGTGSPDCPERGRDALEGSAAAPPQAVLGGSEVSAGTAPGMAREGLVAAAGWSAGGWGRVAAGLGGMGWPGCLPRVQHAAGASLPPKKGFTPGVPMRGTGILRVGRCFWPGRFRRLRSRRCAPCDARSRRCRSLPVVASLRTAGGWRIQRGILAEHTGEYPGLFLASERPGPGGPCVERPCWLVRCSEAAHATWREEPRFEGGCKRDRPEPVCARPCSGRLSTAGVPRGGYASGSSSEVVGTSSRGSSAFFTGASNAGKSVRRDEEMGASPVVRAQAGAGP